MAAPKSTPKDAQVMASILKELGVNDYEPRVLNQMLEFTYRYVTSVLDDAQLFSTHAKKKGIDLDDVELATQLQMDKYFTSPPPRDILLEIARQKNGTTLPIIKSSAGLRLPPDRYSLTACNYRLRSSAKKIRTVHTVSRLNLTSLQPNQGNKVTPAVNLPSRINSTLAVVTKPNSSMNMMSRAPSSLSSLVKPATPIIKFPDANRNSSPVPTIVTTASMGSSSPQMMLPTVGVINSDATSNKRKREDENDDYDS